MCISNYLSYFFWSRSQGIIIPTIADNEPLDSTTFVWKS